MHGMQKISQKTANLVKNRKKLVWLLNVNPTWPVLADMQWVSPIHTYILIVTFCLSQHIYCRDEIQQKDAAQHKEAENK